MKVADALKQLNQSLVEHQLTDWTGGLDNARRRFGICKMNKKHISLSRHLVELNSDHEVLDTILHEIAHALAWEKHGENCGHDKRWQSICDEIGARPEACFDDDVVQPKAPWILVNRETGEVYRSYHKRPTRNWSGVWIRGRKTETLGKLEVRANVVTPKTGDLFTDEAQSDTENTNTNSITQFNAQTVAEFSQRLQQQAEDLAAEYGIKKTNVKGRYNDKKYDLTLTFRVPVGENDADDERLEFEALAGVFELNETHYHSNFTVNGRNFKLIGFKLNNRKYPIIATDVNGQKYKFEETVLDQIRD